MDLLEQPNNRRCLAYPLCLWYSAGNTLWCQIGAMISLWIFFWEKKCRRALVDVLDLVVSVLLELGILFTKIIIVQRIMIRTFNKYLFFSRQLIWTSFFASIQTGFIYITALTFCLITANQVWWGLEIFEWNDQPKTKTTFAVCN